MEIFRGNAGGTVTVYVTHAPCQIVAKGLAAAEEIDVKVAVDGGWQVYNSPGTATPLKLTATITNILLQACGVYQLAVDDTAGTVVVTQDDAQI